MSESASTNRRRTVLYAIVAATLVLLVLAAILLLTRATTGDQIIRQGNAEDIRDVVKMLMDSYSELVTLVTASFGAVAFLVTFQRNQARLTGRAWILFSISTVFLVLALLLAFVGREELLIMVTRNAVDVTLPALTFTRWLCYLCIMMAAILALFFAAEVTFAPFEAESSKSTRLHKP